MKQTHLVQSVVVAMVLWSPLAWSQGNSAAMATPNFNVQDPCRAEVSKFEQAISFVRQSQGTQAAAELKEKLLPAKVEKFTLTLSPRYTVPLGDGLSIGAGPSLGLFRVEAPSAARTLPGLGVAAGLNWRIGALLTGVDVGWHGTRERGGLDQDPLTVGAKIGFSF